MDLPKIFSSYLKINEKIHDGLYTVTHILEKKDYTVYISEYSDKSQEFLDDLMSMKISLGEEERKPILFQELIKYEREENILVFYFDKVSHSLSEELVRRKATGHYFSLDDIYIFCKFLTQSLVLLKLQGIFIMKLNIDSVYLGKVYIILALNLYLYLYLR